MTPQAKRTLALMIPPLLLSLAASGCGGTTVGNPELVEDSSASGAAASAVGGALSGSNQNGTLAMLLSPRKRSLLAILGAGLDFLPEAQATTACPTFRSTGSDCAADGSTSMWLTYDGCAFGRGTATWTGTQALILSAPGTTACGSFPGPLASKSLFRQFVTGPSSTTPGSITHKSSFGTTATIDDATADLGNFDKATAHIAKLVNNGYGSEVDFDASGARTRLKVAHRVAAGLVLDQSITGTLDISESAGATSRTLSGSVQVYHNLLRVIGTSTFNGVTHSDDCCLPESGSITTAFSAGNVAPALLGAKYVGKSETLTFTGCGTAQLKDVDGNTSDVSITRCF